MPEKPTSGVLASALLCFWDFLPTVTRESTMRLGSQVEVKGDSARLVSAQWPMLEDELTGRY